MMLHLVRARRHMARLVTGKAPRRRRVVPRAVWPTGVDLSYRAHLLALMGQMRARVERDLFPRLKLLLSKSGRADALTDDFAAIRVSLLQGAYSSGELGAAVETIGQRTSEWQKKQLQRQLQVAVGVEVPINDPQFARRIAAFTEENVGLIRSIPEDYLAQVQRIVLRGISEGKRWEDLSDAIERRFDVSESRAALIAQDQVGKFYGSLNAARQQAVGLTHFFWRTAGDERVRPEHVALNGERFAWNKPPSEGMPGQPVNCVPEDAPVSLHAPALRGYRRGYSGPLTQIVTDDGRALEATPNHPVLTGRGWLPAHLIEVGEYLFDAPLQSVETVVVDPQGRDASAREFFSALLSLGDAHRIGASTGRFHGDVSDEEIDVVDVNWGLLLERFATLTERSCEHGLARATWAALGLGAYQFRLDALLRASHSIVGSLSPGLSLLGSCRLHPQHHAFAATAWRDAVLNEVATNDTARDLERLGESLLGRAARVLGDQFLARERHEVVGTSPLTGDVHLDPGPAQVLADHVASSPNHRAHLDQREAFLVQPRRVTHLSRREWRGTVTNFETTSGWFGAHGLIVHNCRCNADPDVEALVDSL